MTSSRPYSALIEHLPRRTAWVLGLTIIGLVSIHGLMLFFEWEMGHDHVKGLLPLFDLDRERNIPTLFSACLFSLGSAGFFVLHRLAKSAKAGHVHWFVLAAVFLFLASDEWYEVHERLIIPVRELLGASGVFYYAWVIPYMLAAAVLAAYLLPRLLTLAPEIRYLFFASATVFLLGAVGMEAIGGAYTDYANQRGITRGLGYDLITASEETLEMAGLATLVYAQLRLIRDLWGQPVVP